MLTNLKQMPIYPKGNADIPEANMPTYLKRNANKPGENADIPRVKSDKPVANANILEATCRQT